MNTPACTDPGPSWIIFTTLLEALIPLALGGLALINAGFSRTRAATHTLFTSLFAAALALVSYVSVGFVLQSSPCLANFSVTVRNQSWNVLGAGPFFLRGIPPTDARTILLVTFGALAAALSALIPIGAACERWRLGPALLAASLQAGFVFPFYAHWSWPGGWLNQLRALPGLASVADTGGSGFIHALGGLSALAVVWFAGSRRGKYSAAGMPTATPGHNAPYLLLGSVLACVGWCGLNGAGALLLGDAAVSQIPYVLLNTFAGAIGGIISSAFITRARFGKTDASLCVNGWISGLVAGSAGCTLLRVPEEMLVGLIAGTIVVFAVEIFEMRLKVDDPSGSISVHAVCGLWGLLAVGLFQGLPQITAQLAAISMLTGIVFPILYGLNFVVNRFLPYRINRDGERQGLDLAELGAGAYPEFMLHRDDFNLR